MAVAAKSTAMNMTANELPDFDALNPKQHIDALADVVENAKARIDTLAAQLPPSWQSLMLPLAEIEESVFRLWSPVAHLHSVCNTDDIRPIYERGMQIMTEWGTWLAGHQGLFRAVEALRQSDAFSDLSEAQQAAIIHTLRDFRLAGSALEGESKARFAAIRMRLAELSTRFSQHVLDATQAFELVIEDKSALAGLPESVIEAAAQRARERDKHGYLFTLDIPSYLPLMQYLDDRDVRRQVYRAYVCRASDGALDNTPVIDEILRLRQEMAELLGFDTYADYSLADKMASSVTEVAAFLRDLASKSKPMAKHELRALRSYAKENLGIDTLEAWDIPYASEKLRQERYAISQDALKPWFPETKVKQGMFALAERLYGIRIRRASAPVWHDTVEYYDVLDGEGRKKAGFYLDPYARKGKRGGAWMDEALVAWRFADGSMQYPVAYLVCNFDAPVGDKPALWTHDEVITLFHEFGHGLHHMLTQIDVRAVSGINGVPWDAVELPSQFMENFCWEREVLDLFARHYETDEPLPEAMFEKMTAARNFQSAMQMLRQIEFALFDLLLHAEFDPDGEQSVQQKLDEVRREVAVVFPPAFNRFQNSFSHIFAGGYAAGYYSYKWAEVLSADAYAAFEEASATGSIINPDVARRFLQEVLSRGGSRDMMQSYQAFRGQAPSVDALLKHSGIGSGSS